MSDLIEREAAISYAISGERRREDGEDWIRTSEIRQSLLDMPSAQPEEIDSESEKACKKLNSMCVELKAHNEYLRRQNDSMKGEIKALKFAVRCCGVSGNEVQYESD